MNSCFRFFSCKLYIFTTLKRKCTQFVVFYICRVFFNIIFDLNCLH